jgi:hypothetical protein
VEDHRFVDEGFRRCAREAAEIRRVDEERRERTQLRAADWQDIDMVVDLEVKMMLDFKCREVVL